MAANIAEIRTAVRKDLHDEDSGAYLWTDAVLDRHIANAVADYQRVKPRERTSVLTTTAGSRDISIASLTGLVEILRVEWPTGEYPPHFVGFSVFGTTLTLDVINAPAGVENVNVFWTSVHTLDGSSSTIPAHHDNIIAAGAAAYAAADRGVFHANRINAGGADVWGRYEKLRAERRAQFERELDALRRELRQRQMYATEQPDIRDQARVKY